MNTMHTTYKTKIDGLEVAVRSNTFDVTRKTIVLIHGIGVSSAYFLPFAEQLAPEYNVFTLDLPGYGKTAKPSKPLNVGELAEITASFLITRQLTDVILIGHSMGCQIVAEVNRLRPDKVRNLILLSPTVNRKERTVFMQGLRLLQDTFYEAPKVNFIIFSDYIRMGVFRYLKTSKYMVDNHIEKALLNTTSPCLIVRGENDHIVPRSWTEELRRTSPAVLVREIPHAPHAFQYKHAQEAKDICQQFIEK
jgi:pimeloyl-ACP methyl ester carboxylesterase